ncbi:glycosyltransferase family 32 protein [Zymoseptoria brevis]|uniref:Glycosyltransferase family 32 protein n=1 Tax=Zymoseptoria brevis TaxID=1047168 RepID=A0A0F4G9E9_9PEZI|nr:glycosyltransferase family 32 protein [Zymoseptoria brevis]
MKLGGSPNIKGPQDLFNSVPMGVPKQLQRLLPACIALLLFLYFMTGSGPSTSLAIFSRPKPTHFPRKIWQTWKVDPMMFEERDHNTARTWIIKNPDFRYEVLTDENDLAYVETHFGPEGFNRPDIVYVYRELTARIIKADLLRYMIMYVEGGLYTDIDVEALKPVKNFIPKRWEETDIDMVVGIEIDQPEFSDHPVLGSKCKSFCQWTFMCKPQLPVMLTLIENIMKWLHTVAKQQRCSISEIKLDFDQVISGTGPSAFTEAILKDITKRTGKPMSWDIFHSMQESIVVGRVLVLTVEAFAAGQGHSDSGTHDAKQALVKHHYHASGWPTTHPRFNHPIYGEVEKCNWVAECVKQWDEDTAAFNALPQDQKIKQIAIKEQQVKEEERKQQQDRRKQEEEAARAALKAVAEGDGGNDAPAVG